MNKITTCFLVEWKKLLKSKLAIISLFSISLVPFIVGLFTLLLKYPNLSNNLGLIAAKVEMIGVTDWSSYLMSLSQVISIGGLLIFGFITSWVFGREYSDKTIIDLLVLPIKRDTIVLSKFMVIALWCFLLSFFSLAIALLFGAVISLNGLNLMSVSKGILVFFYCAILVIMLSTPVAFFASFGRGYLSPLAFIIFTMLLSQLATAIGLGEYIPWSIPALASGITGKVTFTPLGLIILLSLSIIGFLLTVYCWKHIDQN